MCLYEVALSHRGRRLIFWPHVVSINLRGTGYEAGFSSRGVVDGSGYWMATGGVGYAYYGGFLAAQVVFSVGCAHSSDGVFGLRSDDGY